MTENMPGHNMWSREINYNMLDLGEISKSQL